MAKRSQGRFVDPDRRGSKNKAKPRRRSARYVKHINDKDELDASLRPPPRSSFNRYLSHHVWVAVSSLGQLLRTPFSTLMTAMVIAIALGLPAGLYLLLGNVKSLTHTWQDSLQFSIFLQPATSNVDAERLQQKLLAWSDVQKVEYISPDQALAEFRELSGFGEAIDTLKQNPLPPVLVVFPTDTVQAQQLQQLADAARKLEHVDKVQLDMEWVRRLAAILEVAQRAVMALAVVLGVAILLIIGNTIRLTIFNRRQEILVTKLIGATNAFIRRPFLYTGIWYGLFGSLLAWILLAVFIALIRSPVQNLAMLYQSQFMIAGLGALQSLALVFGGIALGFAGSWISTSRHLQDIEPV